MPFHSQVSGDASPNLRAAITVMALSLSMCLVSESLLFAQAWDVDARAVALGGIGGSQNVFTSTVDEQRGDHSIVVPLGLIQLLLDRDILDFRSPQFDPVRALEYAADPIHFTFGRNRSDAGALFVSGVRNGALQPDLNTYRGFVPADIVAGGLLTPKWGHTFSLQKRDGEVRQGLYVGAGPYLSLQTTLRVDDGLRTLLTSGTQAYQPNAHFSIADRSLGQGAAAFAGGYRAHFPLRRKGSATASGDATYLAVNLNYLRGFHYEDVDLRLGLGTDQRGLLAPSAQASSLGFTRRTAGSGSGFALDIATGVTFDRFEFGVSASNIANAITWRNVGERNYSLGSLTSGNRLFTVTPVVARGDVRVALPATYRGNASYRGDRWSAMAEVAHDFANASLRLGFEERFRRAELRGAVSNYGDTWLPSGGFSLQIAPRFWVDTAMFSATANIERRTQYSLAMSVRIAARRP